MKNLAKKKQIEEDKRQLRTAAKQKRDALSPEKAAGWSGEICNILQAQTFFREAETVFFYYPLGNEVNLLSLAQTALDLGKQTAFPRVNGSDMEFYRVTDLDAFVEGTFHVMEPSGGEVICGKDALVLIPGLAFDASGNRMGYGKGYYDRYFARYPGCQKIGVCYEMQIVAEVPCGLYDIPMDAVVTEKIEKWRKSYVKHYIRRNWTESEGCGDGTACIANCQEK